MIAFIFVSSLIGKKLFRTMLKVTPVVGFIKEQNKMLH